MKTVRKHKTINLNKQEPLWVCWGGERISGFNSVLDVLKVFPNRVKFIANSESDLIEQLTVLVTYSGQEPSLSVMLSTGRFYGT